MKTERGTSTDRLSEGHGEGRVPQGHDLLLPQRIISLPPGLRCASTNHSAQGNMREVMPSACPPPPCSVRRQGRAGGECLCPTVRVAWTREAFAHRGIGGGLFPKLLLVYPGPPGMAKVNRGHFRTDWGRTLCGQGGRDIKENGARKA